MQKTCFICGKTSTEAGKIYNVYCIRGTKKFRICMGCLQKNGINRSSSVDRYRILEIRQKFIIDVQ